MPFPSLALRHVPPAYSPISVRGLLRGLRALGPGSDPSGRQAVAARVREHFSPRRVVLVDSGTTALRLALRAVAAERPGDPVALPAYGCYDLVSAAVGAGVRIAFYDVDPGSLGPDDVSLRHALALEPSAVVAAHLYGIPVDVVELRHRARAAGAVLIEDAAQGIGAELGGSPLGTFGSLSVLSFGRGKGLTGGGGGAVLALDAAGERALATMRERLPGSPPRGARDLAGALAQWALARPTLYGLPSAIPALRLGMTVYHPPKPPHRASDAALAVLAAGWDMSLAEAGLRKDRAERILESWRPPSGLEPVSPPAAAAPGWLRLPFVAGQQAADRLRRPGSGRHGIMPGYPAALPQLGVVSTQIDRTAAYRFPGAEHLASHLFTLPTHGQLIERDLLYLERLVATGRS